MVAMKILCVIAIFSSILSAQPTANSSMKWPKLLRNRGTVRLLKSQTSQAPYSYTTKHFKFICNRKIDRSKIAKLATNAESVIAAVARIPLPLLDLAAPADSSPEKTPIYISIDKEEYLKFGGAMGSDGYYSGANRSLYLNGERFIFGKRPRYRLLTHELVHHAMRGVSRYCNAWFSEGNAEYFSSAFYGDGSYNFSDMSRSIRIRTKSFYHNRSEPIILPKISDFIKRDSKKWREISNKLDAKDRYKQYLTALLLVHYFYHLDPNGREKIATYLKQIKDPAKHDSAQSTLIPESDIPKIQATITRYWRQKSIKVQFEK